MLLRNKLILSFLLIVVTASAQPDSIAFSHPPSSAKPWIFWYWMQGAVSREGIHADLVAMKEAGIGGTYLMPINGVAVTPIYTPAAPQLSPRWFELVRYAMQQSDSLGLQMALHDCDGFALAGGPWITPELSMQKVVWARTAVDGGGGASAKGRGDEGRVVNLQLPRPEAKMGYYKDIAVLAFPTPEGWDVSTRTVVPRVTTSLGADAQYLVQESTKESFKSDTTCWIQYAFERPFTCRSIVVHSLNNYQAQRLMVLVSDNGVDFRSVGRLVPPRHGWQDGDAAVTHSIPAVTARYFRFVYDKEGSEPGAEDLDAAKWKPSLKVGGIELSAAPVIEGYEGKNGEIWRVSPPTTTAQVADSLCIDSRRVVDLTRLMDSSGRLIWKAPAGHWTILRIGHTSTGQTNATGGAAKGLECDKFNPAAVELQFNSWFNAIVKQVSPALAGKVLKIFHIDSWECGSQNWSPLFREEFRRRRGYDLLKWLPAMAGVPVGSADSSERFLHDIRQTIVELTHDVFYTKMANYAHRGGFVFSAESVSPTMTSDGMLHYSKSDLPMGEFWLRSPTHDKPNDMLDAISGGHVYGKPLIGAEAFTELRLMWDEYPGMLKALQDRNYALGINRMVFHVATHNPWMDRKPGMTLGGVGNFFQRDQTWWSQSKGWIDYTQRCQWMLQQGVPVADIAVFTGEEIPRRAVLPERLVGTLPGLFGEQRVREEALRLKNAGTPTTKVPSGVVHSANMVDPAEWTDPLHGYAFDSFNPDVLLRLASVRDGRVVLPGGASYAMLVLPGASPMTPDPGAVSVDAARKLLELVNSGATVLIDPAVSYHSIGLRNDDKEVKAVFEKLLKGRAIGKGRVLVGPLLDSTLDGIGVARDFEAVTGEFQADGKRIAPGVRMTDITYTHRKGDGWDVYFISNQQDKPVAFLAWMRVTGRQPEIWNAVSGQIWRQKDWKVSGGRTRVSVNLGVGGSAFVVFRRSAGPPPENKFLDADNGTHMSMQLTGPWKVNFDTAFGGPAGTVVFDSLMDWSKHKDTAIRYYSGTAAYSQSFNFYKTGRSVLLMLGKVANIATVYVNGINCGTVWTNNSLDIGNAVITGVNTIRIEVANTWANRLTGDLRLPEGRRRTWTTSPWKSDGELLPAGLLGPVYIVH